MPSSKDNPVSEPAHCPVRTTLALIGGKHKAFILWNLFDGTKRFSQLQKAVTQANAKMLSQQLKELEHDGLISRKAYAVVPPKVEYSLTDLGKSLKPVLSCVYEWGTSYLQSRGISPDCSMQPLDEKSEQTSGSACCCGHHPVHPEVDG